MNLSRLAAAKFCTAVITSALLVLLLGTISTHSYARGPEAKPVPSTGGDGDGTPIEEPEATPDDGKDGGGPPPRPGHGDDSTPEDGAGWILEQVLRALNVWIMR